MSTVAFGALATLREQAPSGTSTSSHPPGIGTYVDVLTALVPAEVLAINAVVVTLASRETPGGGTQPMDPGTLRLAFWLLTGLSVVLYILGRRPSLASAPSPLAVGTHPSGQAAAPSVKPAMRSWLHLQRWEPEDFLRFPIPPLSFLLWSMLDPASTWSSVVPGMSSASRILIGLVGATALAAIAKALATHADLKSPTGAVAGARAAKGNAGAGTRESLGQGDGNQRPWPGQQPANGPGGQPPGHQLPSAAAGVIPAVPAAPPAGVPPPAISAGPPWVGSP